MRSTFTMPLHPKAGLPTQSYVYRSADDAPVLVANRFDPKGRPKFFLPYDVARRDWKAPVTRPLYNLDTLTSADPATPVIFVEGEKCADGLAAMGYLTTTSFGGCKALAKTDLAPLASRSVTIWPDHDAPGTAYATQLMGLLQAMGCTVNTIDIHVETIRTLMGQPDMESLEKGWDAMDAIESGWTVEMVERLLGCAPQSSYNSGELAIIRYNSPLPDMGHSSHAAPSEPIINHANSTEFTQKDANSSEITLNDAHSSKTTQKDAIESKGKHSNSPETTSIRVNSPDTYDLWHSPEREPYASVTVGNHIEHWPIGSNTFRNLLSHQHYQTEGKLLTQNALDDRRRTLQGEALFDGECNKVFLRIGDVGRTLYLNLGDKDWKAVSIDAQGWQVIDRPPVRFQRSASMAALPLPVPHPDGIDALRPFLNVATEADFRMLVAWLIGCFHPRGPYPILILTGEQGSAKSTTARVLRSLIDPASPIARSAPQNEQDLVIAAKHNHVLSFDNLSTIKPQLADALCRIATGGGFGTRKLHSDTDEVLFTATRPILLNGIPDLAHRPDLADRAIIVTLPVITPTARQFEAEFWKSFDRAAPGILAALLDAVSTALARIGTVTITERPRMADFAKWITAAEPALGWPDGAFLDAYTSNRLSVQNAAIDGNPVAEAILQLASRGPWSGTATDLLKALRSIAPMLTDDPLMFPRHPNKLAGALRRVQPLLRGRGVVIAFDREGGTGHRVIRLEGA
jgi:putative DNA primase/helicase